MSLLKRIESARPGTSGPGAAPGNAPAPAGGAPGAPGQPPARAGPATHVVAGSGPGILPGRQVPDPEPGDPGPGSQARPVQPGRGPAPDRRDLRQGHRRGRPRPDPCRARPDAGADHRRDHRPRPARAAPARREHHRDHGQRPAPGLHRAVGQAGADQRGLPERRPRDADHRPDHRPDRPPRRRVVADGRRPPDRRLPRQRDHPAAVAGRAGHHHPEVLGLAVHRRRPGPLRDGHARDVRLPQGLRRSPPEHLRLRRHRLGQDHDPQRAVVVHPQRRADRHDRGRGRAAAPPGARRDPRVAARRTSRARARSRSASSSATPCGCGPTGSSSASAVRARRSTCSRP